jgi:hypothetical protein
VKIDYNMGDTSFDCVCKLLHETLLPPGNLFPPSTYLMQKIADVESIEDVEYHTCDCLDYIYPKIDRKDWLAHSRDKCEKCGLSRFLLKKVGGNVIRTPRKVS